MKKVFIVLAAALIALPIFAEQEKLTPSANRPIVGWKTPTRTNTSVGPVPPTPTRTKFVETTRTRTPTKKNPDTTPATPTPTGVANKSINLNSSRSNRVVRPTVTPAANKE